MLLMISRSLLPEAQGIYPTVHWSEKRVARALFLHSVIEINQGKLNEAHKLRSNTGFLRQQLV